MNIVEILENHSVKHADQIAITHGAEKISFKELAEQSCKGGNYFKNLGLQKGDVVVVFVPMSINLYIILIALWRLGLIAMFLDPSSDKKQLEQCCMRVKPKVFIGTVKAQIMRFFTPALRKIPLAVSTGYMPWGNIWSDRNRCRFDCIPCKCKEDDAALITFTSGSTGFPKGIVRTHGFLSAQNKVLQKTLALKTGNSDLATLPIFALINLASGITTHIPCVNLSAPGKIDADSVLDDMARKQPQTAVASPAFYECLLKSEKRGMLRCLRSVFVGGAPVFPGLLKRLQSNMPKSQIVAVYGSTEAEPIAEIVFSQISENDFTRMSAGKGLLAGSVVEAVRCHIIKDSWGIPHTHMTQKTFSSLQVAKNVPGEIVVHGDHVLKTYLDGVGDLENKFAVDGEIWHRTGDLGYFDTFGRLWLLGRCSAVICDESGELYPFAVEAAAMQYEDVFRAAMCGVNGKRILVLESSRSLKSLKKILESVIEQFNITHLLIQKIPMDKRHNAKIDYPLLLRSIKNV